MKETTFALSCQIPAKWHSSIAYNVGAPVEGAGRCVRAAALLRTDRNQESCFLFVFLLRSFIFHCSWVASYLTSCSLICSTAVTACALQLKAIRLRQLKKKAAIVCNCLFFFFLICYTPNRRYWIANYPDFDESLQGTKKEPIMSFYEQIYVCM